MPPQPTDPSPTGAPASADHLPVEAPPEDVAGREALVAEAPVAEALVAEALVAEALVAEALAWAGDDVDPRTATELRELVRRVQGGDAAARTELADRFAGPLQFGTAGLRGALGAGPNRMNRAVVIRAAAGLAAFLLERAAAPGAAGAGSAASAPPRVVIGYDARHGSATFARDTAAVMTGAGLRAVLLPRALPTPVLAHAVRHLRPSGGPGATAEGRHGADAGVMVTASHNPAGDNGYKVYLGGEDGGSQIVPPADERIAARIAAVDDLTGVARPTTGWEVLDSAVVEQYLEGTGTAAAAVTARAGGAGARTDRARLRIVLTPMHGVGGALSVEALRRAGFTDVAVVPEQAVPDPDFPTQPFPNPEEPGALDLALALARSNGAHLVLAVDPDADRCAVAVPDPGGQWRALTGDELGAVLGEALARAAAAQGREGVLACSVVSSRMLLRIAAAHGLRSAQTLTGFKWISRVPDLLYGYEEAIGYCVAPDAVRDKDGISAAVLVAALAADLAASGRTLLDALDELDHAHGVHATAQLSIRVEDLAVISGAMAQLRAAPPAALAGSAVVEAVDLLAGTGTGGDADGGGGPAGLPPTDGLLYRTQDDARVVVRPSGTEPKLKAYLEAVVPVVAPAAGSDDVSGAADRLAVTRALAMARLQALRTDLSAALGL